MIAATLTVPTATRSLFALDKRIATLAARAALAGAQLVEIEADDGGLALLLTAGPRTFRFDRSQIRAVDSAIAQLEARRA